MLSQAQHNQQQYLAGNSTANLLARFMMPPINMVIVGLTGGIATGKSTVSEIFRSHGLHVVDADLIARKGVMHFPELL
ncbi:unnamed protein product [Heligmosomoides polygyrus]|uniref:Dephospho-CoA kinase n=1 Tax=Heligmosomoides polygyrus TaxID=6339 RepID=A0A3P8HGB8_HELPZ|nr:unnamed protein product [Heligmosomoides polygyrus]